MEKMVSELDHKEFGDRGNLGTWYFMTGGNLVKGLEGSALWVLPCGCCPVCVTGVGVVRCSWDKARGKWAVAKFRTARGTDGTLGLLCVRRLCRPWCCMSSCLDFVPQKVELCLSEEGEAGENLKVGDLACPRPHDTRASRMLLHSIPS